MPLRRWRLPLLFFFLAAGAAAFAYDLFRAASKITLYADDKIYTLGNFPGRTVRDLLEKFDVKLSGKDFVRPGLEEPVRRGQRVHVIRVTERVEEKTEEIDFILAWKRRTSQNLRLVEIQNGHRRQITYRVKTTLRDGFPVEAEKKVKRIERVPVQRLVLLSKEGRMEKIYDLSRARKLMMIATAYWEGDPQVPGVFTYLDHRIERGIVAVDPSVIPLRSRLFIPGYGYAYASDTGSAIKGNRIDLVVPNKKASREWEYRKVTVYVLEKAAGW